MVPVSGLRLHLRLRHARRAGGLDHRLGPDDRVRDRQRRGGHLLGQLLQHAAARRSASTSRAGSTIDYRTRHAEDAASSWPRRRTSSASRSSSTSSPSRIVTLITVVLVWGIRESRQLQLGMVAIKLVVLGFFVIVSFKYVKPAQLASVRARTASPGSPPAPPSSSSPTSASTRSRRRRGGEESEARHADRHHRLADHLHDHLHRGRRACSPA